MPLLYNVRVWKRDNTWLYLCGNGSSAFEVYRSNDNGATWSFVKSIANNGYMVRAFGVYPGETLSDDTFFIYAHKDGDRPRVFSFKSNSASVVEEYRYVHETTAIANLGAFLLKSDGSLWLNGGLNRGTFLIKLRPDMLIRERFNFTYSNINNVTKIVEASGGTIIFYWAESYQRNIGVTVDGLSISTPVSIGATTSDTSFAGCGRMSNGTIVILTRFGTTYSCYYSMNNGQSFSSYTFTTHAPVAGTINNDIIYFSTEAGNICKITTIGGSPEVVVSNVGTIWDFVLY